MQAEQAYSRVFFSHSTALSKAQHIHYTHSLLENKGIGASETKQCASCCADRGLEEKENCRLYCIGIRFGRPMGFHTEHDK